MSSITRNATKNKCAGHKGFNGTCVKKSGHVGACRGLQAVVSTPSGSKIVSGFASILSQDPETIRDHIAKNTDGADRTEMLEHFHTKNVKFGKKRCHSQLTEDKAKLEEVEFELKKSKFDITVIRDVIREQLRVSDIHHSIYSKVIREEIHKYIETMASHYDSIYVLKKMQKVQTARVATLKHELSQVQADLAKYAGSDLPEAFKEAVVRMRSQETSLIEELKVVQSREEISGSPFLKKSGSLVFDDEFD